LLPLQSFEDWVQLVVMYPSLLRPLRRNGSIILLLATTVGGCLPDRATNDVATCRTEADRFYSTPERIDAGDPRSQFIIGCMAARGYDFTISPADCDGRSPMPSQAACYQSKSWL